MRCLELSSNWMPMSSSGTEPADGVLDIDAVTFRECFDRGPFQIGHDLTNHPLFEISRLMQLCRTLPETSVEYNAGNIPISVDSEKTPGNGLSAEETIRRIAECKSWLVLKYVEQDPQYRALLHRCLAEVARHSELLRPGMFLAQGFIFISSPGSVTPYHMDPEHNFLLQLRGSKRIHIFDGRDRSILTEEELEQFYGGAHRNLTYRNNCEGTGWTFDLRPGFGLHFPVTAPHYVRNGPEVSVSFSITFRTPDLKRRRMVHICNAFLRRRGLSPAPAGKHPRHDFLKYLFYGAASRIHRLFRGGEPPRTQAVTPNARKSDATSLSAVFPRRVRDG
ncbi:MAG TPA: hypothetical protein VJT81_19255 [Burkholderiales bacterium]|nr:hypothetical protein [Burkholderiales bacterium]